MRDAIIRAIEVAQNEGMSKIPDQATATPIDESDIEIVLPDGSVFGICVFKVK